jgi:hypothetical protein
MDVQIQRALAHPRRRAILGYLMQEKGAAERYVPAASANN